MEKVLISLFIIFVLVVTLYACMGGNTCKHDDPAQNVVCEAKDPTCQEPGATEGIKCNLCGKMVIPQIAIEPLGCTPGEWIIDKESSKTEDGLRHTECTVCGLRIDEVIYAGSTGLMYRVEADGKTCTIKGIGTCTDTEIVIPTHIDGYEVVRIGSDAFENCEAITTVSIPNTVKSVGEAAFVRCSSLTSIDVAGDNEYLQSIDGSLYTKDGKTLIWYARGNQDKSFKIPDHVETITGWAFYGCTTLENITIPSSITNISRYAFRECASLTTIYIPDSVTSIDNRAFSYCSSLTTINIPSSVTRIGEKAFGSCANLEKIYFDGTVAQWIEVVKEEHWNDNAMAYTIYCSNGEIARDGTVTYYGE